MSSTAAPGHTFPSPYDRYLAPLLLAAAVFVIVFGVELFHFGLSIDEEAATYVTDTVRIALAQGRWGISLALLCMPNIGPIPLISTLLFGAGLLFATRRAFDDFALTRAQAFVFAAVHVAFPVWLHIVQFSTIAGIVGLGIAAAVAGARAAVAGSLTARFVGALLIAYAVSVYQTLGIYCALYVVFALYARLVQHGEPLTSRTAIRSLVKAVATVLAGLVLYTVIQRTALFVTGTKTEYIDVYLHPERFRREPLSALHDIAIYVGQLVGGRHPAYLGWGVAVLLPAWMGLLPIGGRDGTASVRRHWLGVLTVAAIGVALVAVPTVMSIATLPLRAYVALPLLAAWLASRVTFRAGTRLAVLHAAVIAYFVLVTGAISARLFYSDDVVHNADAALTQQLMARMDLAALQAGMSAPIPFTIVGARGFPFAGEITRSEQFGASFYEQDDGNVYRVAYYMQLQGHPPLQPIWLGHRQDLVAPAKAMPTWPADGAVQVVNGVVVIKLGAPTQAELKTD